LRLRDHLAGETPADFALQKCSVIGNVECDLVDLVVIRRALAPLLPTVSQVCPPAVP
jgi:hypothetical protein